MSKTFFWKRCPPVSLQQFYEAYDMAQRSAQTLGDVLTERKQIAVGSSEIVCFFFKIAQRPNYQRLGAGNAAVRLSAQTRESRRLTIPRA